MSTLRITNIEAKADPSSPTVDEKIKLTNSNGDILVHIDGKTSGITTIGINTTAGNIKFDQNSNVVVTGIITATKFVGTIEPTTLTVGGDLTIPDKIVHTGDTNTAIRFPAADTITAETAGTERLRIDSTGDVRFAGTNLTNNTNKNVNLTAPSYNTSEEDVNLVQVENESGMNQISFGGGTSGLNAATSLRFLTASAVNTTTGTERLLITSDGKVGINQSTPQTTFHSTGTTNGQQATFGIDNSGLKISTFQKTDNDAGVILDAQKSSNGTLTFATAGTERFRITSAGKIGFNATNPPRDYCFHSGQADTNIQITNNTTGIDDSAGALIQQDGNDLYIWNKENSFMSLGTNAGERLRITSGGDVLIADTTNSVWNDSSGGGINLKANGQIVAKKEATSTADPLIWLNDTGQTTNKFIAFAQDGTEKSYIGLSGNDLLFGVNGGDRARIDSDGHLQIRREGVASMSNVDTRHTRYIIRQNNGQEAILGSVFAQGKSGWGGDLVFASKNANGNPSSGLTERMRIDASGYVTKPNTPAFFVYKNQSSWALAANDVFVFNTAELNVGGHYNTTNGRFTAPITARYVFHFYSIFTGNANSDSIEMYKNGARMYGGDVHFTNDVGSAWDCVHYSRVIQLSSGDYVHMQTRTGHTFHGNHWGGWSGYMLG